MCVMLLLLLLLMLRPQSIDITLQFHELEQTAKNDHLKWIASERTRHLTLLSSFVSLVSLVVYLRNDPKTKRWKQQESIINQINNLQIAMSSIWEWRSRNNAKQWHENTWSVGGDRSLSNLGERRIHARNEFVPNKQCRNGMVLEIGRPCPAWRMTERPTSRPTTSPTPNCAIARRWIFLHIRNWNIHQNW